MKLSKKRFRRRGYASSNFRALHTGRISVDDDYQVMIDGNRDVCPTILEYRWHFFRLELGDTLWKLVVKKYGLHNGARHSCRSYGVRKGEGSLVGLYPKRPIHIIQEERGKEAGEESWRTMTDRELTRLIKRDLKEAAAQPDQPLTTSLNLEGVDWDFYPFCGKENDIPF